MKDGSELFIRKLPEISLRPLAVVPEAGLEPARSQTPRDFKSLASTKFRHSGFEGINGNKGTKQLYHTSRQPSNNSFRSKNEQGHGPFIH